MNAITGAMLFLGIVVATLAPVGLLIWYVFAAKRRKIAKQYGLDHFLSGYYMFRAAEEPNMFIIADGLFGANATHLVFDHRSTPDAINKQIEFAKIRSFELFAYDVSEEIFEQNKELDVRVHGVESHAEASAKAAGGFLESITESAIIKWVTNSVLKMHNNEYVARITLYNGDVSFFYYKNSYRNADIISEIQRNI